MRKLIFVVLVVFGLVNVGFGVEIPKYHDSKYQKLKTEVEMWEGEECKYNESGKLVGGDIMCDTKNVLAFFDEIRATEVKRAKTETEYDEISIAMRKVMEMPRFKNGGGIPKSYIMTFNGDRKAKFRSEKGFWEYVWQEWDKTKRELKIRGIKGEYWKAVKRESE